MNIILVDDEITITNILKETVPWEKLGIRKVYVAYNVFSAKEIILTNHIDILLCDIEMPQESGLELIKWIQGIFPEIVNIILTGYPDFNYARSAISLGVYRFLVKPAAFDELELTIADAIEKIEQEYLLKNNRLKYVRTEEITKIEKVKKYLEDHFDELITRKDIESLVHMNRDHINRLFKQNTGYTLMEYIQYYRVLIGKKLLRETDRSIAEISTYIGYDSPAYFSKVFKKRTELTPIEYREKNEK